jgi:hypothetical protein
MGYITNYTLEHDVTAEDWEDVQDQFDSFGAGPIFDDGGSTCVSWYEHEEDMRHISALCPEFTFTLTGIGETNGDLWKKRFQAGKVEEVRAEIVWPEFEELTDEVGV